MLKNIFNLSLLLLLTLALFYGCKKEDDEMIIISEPDPITITVDPASTYQTIAGFGGANRMWGTQFLKPAEAKKAFGLGADELGLSIFRVRIASNPDEWPRILESVQEAQSYGVKIQASPWSPPPALKNNNSEIDGRLLAENYEAFKDHINDFVAYMNANGVDIYAISLQNEPDIEVSYESCRWTVTQMADFLANYGDQIENTKIAAPESFNFDQSFTNGLLTNDAAAQNLDIVAGHIYGGGLAPFPLAESKGKEIWMTEYLLNLNTGNSGAPAWTTYSENEIWEETLTMLNTIHQAMENNWNAYIWWYLQRYYSFIGDGEQGTVPGEILKRGYAFSHFSKYVRPGFTRVDIQSSRSTNLDITAYEGDQQTVIVIINAENSPVSKLNLAVPGASAAAAFETSVNRNREEKTVELADGKVILNISQRSITTVIVDK